MSRTPEEFRAERERLQSVILEGLEALLAYHNPDYEWPAPQLETYAQVSQALLQWPERRSQIMRGLEDDFLGRGQPTPAQALQWLDEVIHLGVTLRGLADSLQEEQEFLEMALEQWIDRMAEPLLAQPEPEERPINNPACYKTDLFGNPIEEQLEIRQEQQ